MKRHNETLLRRIRKDQSGGVAVIVGLSMVALVGFAGLGVDLGYAYYCKSTLQAVVDAATLAGAQNINVGSGGTAITTVNQYSGTGPSLYNVNTQMTVTMASGYPVLKCLTSTGVSCSGPDSANAVMVQENAVVPTFFLSLFGLPSWHLSATALGSAKGGTPQPLDVEIILDTTASMNNSDPNCSIPGATREDCALAGVRTLLSAMAPCAATLSNCGTVINGNVANPVDRVGLMVFPGLTNATQTQYEYDCSTNPSPAIAKYSASPVYQIVPFSSDYRTSDNATSLNSASQVVKAARGGAPGCQQGLTAVGGVGTYYADAITQAQSTLASGGRATARKMIILISDGAANATAANMPVGKVANQCNQAITAAQAATSAGTWVYSISYGSSTATSPSLCTTDAPVISSCSTMQSIASDSTKYFSDTSGGDAACTSTANPIQNLNTIFSYIGVSASTSRLIPLNTT
jgi:Flp pilus assembly protein TadG